MVQISRQTLFNFVIGDLLKTDLELALSKIRLICSQCVVLGQRHGVTIGLVGHLMLRPAFVAVRHVVVVLVILIRRVVLEDFLSM